MTTKRIGFRVRTVYKMKKPRVLQIARQKLSFMVASMSLFAFVIGNMVGQHGWYAFWKTVLGKEDDTAIIFVGTVAPVSQVPDYTKWGIYGGGSDDHTYRMVPKDLLIPLPSYDVAELRERGEENLTEAVYSVGNLGDYHSGADHGGSHVGVDIRVPLGTPVLSIANGIVEKVSVQEYGFGHYVMVRHPNVPDADNPGETMTIHSVYAHLDQVLPVEGQIVHKGEQIGTSGQTGFASGPHLHFQIDRDDAPFHPYWPFTSAEASDAKLSFNQAINRGLHQERGEQYTISPVLFAQKYIGHVQQNVASTRGGTAAVTTHTAASRRLTPTEKLKVGRDARMQARLAKAGTARPIVTSVVAVGGAQPSPESSSSSAPSAVAEVVKTADVAAPVQSADSVVHHLEIQHSGTLSRLWQKVRILALDKHGDTVKNPVFSGKVYVVAEFGEAEIRPGELAAVDFKDGVATINVLTRGMKTLILGTRGAFETVSAPMVATR